ncbi:1-acylglycerol-3-phosphate O-acyltransferase [Gracilariopsis chorda]|uniref:1-acylglycerol-3-phosphate O-acyltransferase n=1 Tax=Gracilariopsis chorda TaxID=448386 RepID=A0A2V3J0X6_9FLOR|nr:1-acylglycerol-3-phosphate O-acyltransferase [Gracilariopsis chorda]|eukprot:PXF47975.1 1-acylglycerol-3-phosphate O-acyltransferase [Gracilariopsis chorda]
MRRFLFWMLFRLWDLGFTPQYLVRLGGTSLGRVLARKIIESRFQMQSQSAREALVDYFYHISAADAAGEHSLSTILQSGAYARDPLCDRMDALKVPTVFLYGELDWMNYRYAKSICERMSVPTSVHVVEGAGHHLYFDNVNAFTQVILKTCRSSAGAHDAVVCEEKRKVSLSYSQNEYDEQELPSTSQKDQLGAPFPACGP